mgnify:CR=1 FL=1|jgi:hypothetical protein
MTQTAVLLLCAGGVLLGLIAVVIDRLNFPQRRFTAKGVRIDPTNSPNRDRTGAHIIDLEETPEG